MKSQFHKCEGIRCTKREQCERFTRESVVDQQKWASFYAFESCDYFIKTNSLKVENTMAGKPKNQLVSDADLIDKINKFMLENKNCIRSQVMTACNTTIYRMDRLEKAGLVKLPRKLSLSQAATLGRKRNNTANNFYINRPAPWQGT